MGGLLCGGSASGKTPPSPPLHQSRVMLMGFLSGEGRGALWSSHMLYPSGVYGSEGVVWYAGLFSTGQDMSSWWT